MRRENILKFAASMLLALGALTAAAAPKANVATNAPPAARSIFLLPLTPTEGRDPFFPDSKRPYEIAAAASGRKPATDSVSELVIHGFVGTGGSRTAVINNHTFAAGDDGDVLTAQGRIHIHCIAVKEDSVVIEVDGERHELKFHDNL